MAGTGLARGMGYPSAVDAKRNSIISPLLLLLACGSPLPLACGSNDSDQAPTPANPEEVTGEVVTPPFAVSGNCDGLFLYYFDGDGVHAVEHREDVPEAARSRVRIESPSLAPEDRLDPDTVYIADLGAAGTDGKYVVRSLPRDVFDAWVDHATGHDQPEAVADATSVPVIIYGASWCGACRSLEAYLDSLGVRHEDKDIERDPGARAEMQRKARAAGVNSSGIPVVDIDGNIFTGFDRQRVDQLLARRPQGAAPDPAATPHGATPPADPTPAPAPGTVPI